VSESLVRVGVTALSSIAVTATATLSVIKRNLYGTGPIIWLFEATISTLAITTVSDPHHSEDNTADKCNATKDRRSDNDRQVAFDLSGVSGERRLKKGREMNALGQTPPSLSSSSTAPAMLLVPPVARGSEAEEEGYGWVEGEEEGYG
jgi:hypothetical protein